MSKVLIQHYYNNLDRAVQFGKTNNETSIRNHFWNLLNDYARKQNYEVVTEAACVGTKGKPVRPDGILKNLFGLDIGLWESKDEKDDLDEEIDAKRKKGYPFTNILFEDSQTAALFQYDVEVMRVPMSDADKLHQLISFFIAFKNETVVKFEEALEKFKTDIPVIVETLRKRISASGATNTDFLAANRAFLELCKAEINPDVTEADVREMMIQHVLTSDLFNKIFDDADFHRHNNIARELEKLNDLLFTRNDKRNLLANIEHYYDAINAAAAGVTDHHEKQKFLKVLYENFYKVYNPKAADRLGVVYTPNEIVTFMIESADALLHTHFSKTLADKHVEILDPATGTGTFIAALIDHLPKKDLLYKYQHEIHANEVAILPYYIANLNIEFTFKQRMGLYEEFKNLCFVDTLDNIGALDYEGKQTAMFALSSENSARIKRQNDRKISVVIGNPPYNANQLNENENNKNRDYPAVDKRIKETYIKQSTAQKTKVYDMYARFYRWAMDRIDKNGIIAYITNRSFIDSRTFDGFRKCVENDFAACYIVDTKSDVRANPKIAGTTHNVFGIQTGVAMMFLVRKEKQSGKCKIFYTAMDDFWRKEEKLDWLRHNKFDAIQFEKISPDKNGNWINLADNDFDTLLPLANKETKLAKGKKQEQAVFKLFSLGVSTNRDEWVYDYDAETLTAKIKHFAKIFNQDSKKFKGKNAEKIGDELNDAIKWSSNLKANLVSGNEFQFDKKLLINSLYRPFFKQAFYAEPLLNDRLTDNHVQMFGEKFDKENNVICISGGGASAKSFTVLATKYVVDIHFNGDSNCLPMYRYGEGGARVENITDWGLARFRERYAPSPRPSPSGRGSKEGDASESGVVSESGVLSKGEFKSPLPEGEDLGEGEKGRLKKKLPEKLLKAARELRRNATDAEKLLWAMLRNRQLEGYKFRRQHPLGKFVLDFYCHEEKLCVELDGGHHTEAAQARRDQERTAWLNREGIRVIRFWNNDVLNNIEGVLQTILVLLATPAGSPSSPLPEGNEGKRQITKEDIFHYVYAVLHNPAYRKKYELNLKREFPRVPFYDDFWQWAAWGKRLMELHLTYESVVPFGLNRLDSPRAAAEKNAAPKPKLKLNKERNAIELDEETTLVGVPPEALEYKLGNRSALEWILDQYKESAPKDKTIAEKFNTYRFADYKERVIDLLQRVCMVSVETVKIVREIEKRGA